MFSNDVTAAILVFQTDPVVVELFLLLQEIWIDAGHQSENAPQARKLENCKKKKKHLWHCLLLVGQGMKTVL